MASYMMCSAVDFLPSIIMRLTTWVTRRLLYIGSGWMSRLDALALLAMAAYAFLCLFAQLDAVLGATLLTVGHSGCVESRTDDLVADTRQVFDPATPDEDHGVLLQVVPDAGDVGSDFH